MNFVFETFEDLREFATYDRFRKMYDMKRPFGKLKSGAASPSNPIRQQLAISPMNLNKKYQIQRMKNMANRGFESLQDLVEFAAYRQNERKKGGYFKNAKEMKSRKRCPECGKKNCDC